MAREGIGRSLLTSHVGGKLTSSSSLDGMRCRRGRWTADAAFGGCAGIGGAGEAAGSGTG